MDIIETLKKYRYELTNDDLEYYIVELETGSYSKKYVDECREIIDSIKEERKVNEPNRETKGSSLSSLKLKPSDLFPDCPKEKELTPEEECIKKIQNLRIKVNSLVLFKEYILKEPLINEAFIDKNFKKFNSGEIDVIIENKELSEDFLEKYFNEIDLGKVSHFQKFSEDFFMKHFNELNVNTILTKGPNEWRNKSNRSSKLNVFLKLKGVNL